MREGRPNANLPKCSNSNVPITANAILMGFASNTFVSVMCSRNVHGSKLGSIL